MADVKWIKLIVNIFDDTKIKLIEKLPQGDTIIVIWFKLLCLAGKANENGAIMINSEIAFNEDMLIAYLDREPIICKLALQTFEQYRMIEIIDNIFLLANWEKHQNIDGLNTIREQNKLRQQKYRDNKKNLKIETKNKEEDLDIERERYVTLRNINKAVVKEYNNIPELSSVAKLTDKRTKSINARIKDYSYEQVIDVIAMVSKSDFLRGINGDWKCNFDWIMNPNNFVKILEGNYKNKEKETIEFDYSTLD